MHPGSQCYRVVNSHTKIPPMTRKYISPPDAPDPQPAATVMLVRDGTDSMEIFLMQRTATTHFGGMYVFPGGKVDRGDSALENICQGLSDATASALLGLPEQGLAFWAACIRECFEEAGLLLAVNDEGVLLPLQTVADREHFGVLRQKLNAGELSIEDICRSENLMLAANRLAYCAHWITPEAEKRRFDTRFFIALAPPGQEAIHDGGETVDSLWITPGEALERMHRKEINMIPPTYMNLQTLVPFTSAAAVLEHFTALHPGSMETIAPRIFSEDGKVGLELRPGQDVMLTDRQGQR